MPAWRNGIRSGLKIHGLKRIEGSTPSAGTIFMDLEKKLIIKWLLEEREKARKERDKYIHRIQDINDLLNNPQLLNSIIGKVPQK